MASDNSAPAQKRFKLEECEPSRVVMIADLVPAIDDREIVALFSRFGNVVDMLRISHGRSALLQFEDISVSKMMVTQAKKDTFFIGSIPVKLAFGNTPAIVRKKGAVMSTASVMGSYGSGPPAQPPMQQQQPPPPAAPVQQPQQAQALTGLPGRVLLFTVANAVYPITVDVLKTICGPCGNVLRISVGPKRQDNSLEALVEFESVADASRAIDSLNGADIYSGCCTLTVTLSHLPVLQIFKNDADSWDFTNPNPGAERAALLGSSPAVPQAPQPQQQPPYQQPPYQQQPPYRQAYQQDPQQHQQYRRQMNDRLNLFTHADGTVIMAQNLPEGLGCQNLFNIACLYGNVGKVKFLRSRPGCALMQMGTPEQSGYVIQHLSGLCVFGQKVEIGHCKQPEVQVHAKPDLLPNGTPMSMCFEDSINNRFRKPELFTKSRLVAPTRTLHFFNFPPTNAEADVHEFFSVNGGPTPQRVLVFKPKPDQKCAVGLAEFDGVENAALAVMRCNHTEIKVDEKVRFHAKLSFSTKPIEPDDPAAASFGQEAPAGNGDSA